MKVCLPRDGHSRGERARLELHIDAERTLRIVGCGIQHHAAHLDARKERSADASFERGSIQCVRLFGKRQLVEWDRRWLRARPVGVERALSPTLHPFVLRLGDERSTNVLVRLLRQFGHLSDPGFRIPQRAGDPDTLRCGVRAVAGKHRRPGGEIVDTVLGVTTRRGGDLAHPVQHRDPAQQGIDVLRKRDPGCVSNCQRRIGYRRRLVIDHVVKRHGVLDRRREIRRCDQYPRGVGLDSLSAAVESHLRTHRPIRCVVAPSVVIREIVERRTRGNRLRLAKPAEHDQSAGGVSQKVADRHVHVHESSVQPFHSLARPADRVGPRVNDQVFLRRVLVAPYTLGSCFAFRDALRRGLPVHQVYFPLDPRVRGGDFAHRRNGARTVGRVLVNSESRALPLDARLAVFVSTALPAR